MRLQDLEALKPRIKMGRLARDAGINEAVFYERTRSRESRDLYENEARLIRGALIRLANDLLKIAEK